MKQTTTEFQRIGSTVFLLEESGKRVMKTDGHDPVLRNRVMIQVSATSHTLSGDDVAYLTNFLVNALNNAVNDKHSVFREVIVKDVVEDDDDDHPDLENQLGEKEYLHDR